VRPIPLVLIAAAFSWAAWASGLRLLQPRNEAHAHEPEDDTPAPWTRIDAVQQRGSDSARSLPDPMDRRGPSVAAPASPSVPAAPPAWIAARGATHGALDLKPATAPEGVLSDSSARAVPAANDPSVPLGREELSARWETERSDPSWTAGAREYLNSALKDAHLPADCLQAVDCRASLCKIEVAFPSMTEAMKLNELRDPDSELRAFPTPGVPNAYSVFMARASAPLFPPQPDGEEAAAAAALATSEHPVREPGTSESPTPQNAAALR
jgi:hypothetical protein